MGTQKKAISNHFEPTAFVIYFFYFQQTNNYGENECGSPDSIKNQYWAIKIN